jgi:thioredoxin-like negative regulator of GroEL
VRRLVSLEDYLKLVGEAEAVLVEFFSEANPLSRYYSRIVEELGERLGPRVVVVRIDVDEAPEIAEYEGVEELPYVKLYYKGKPVWSQEGCFGKYSMDIVAARRGIRQVFRSKGIPLRI